MRVDFRAASAQDIPELAAVKIASWRSAYASFVLAKSLDALTIERELPEFERRFARSDVAGFVAQSNGRIVGYAIAGVGKTPNEGEIMSLYLLPEAIGHGIGSQLLREGLSHLQALTLDRAYAWCLLENPRALTFYERHGAQRGRESNFTIDERAYAEVRMEWPDLARLKLAF